MHQTASPTSLGGSTNWLAKRAIDDNLEVEEAEEAEEEPLFVVPLPFQLLLIGLLVFLSGLFFWIDSWTA